MRRAATVWQSCVLPPEAAKNKTAEGAEITQGTQRGMNENLVGEKVLGCALKVHRNLAPGLLEGAYEACLTHELARSGLAAKRQVVMPVRNEDIEVELGYRLDLLVEDCVVVEVKAVDRLVDVHRAQVIGYLRLGGHRLGYLLNFNVPVLKDGIVRIANGL